MGEEYALMSYADSVTLNFVNNTIVNNKAAICWW